MSEPGVESLQQRAEEHLRLIRQMMGRASTFTALPGWGGVAMGAVGVVAAAAAAGAAATDERQWVSIWLTAAGVAVPIGAISAWDKARRAGVTLYRGTARLFVLSLATPILAGAILTAALVWRQAYGALPAAWLTSYGAAAVVGGNLSVRPVPAMGGAFMVLGAFAVFAPLTAGNLLMGLGFGVLHITTGLIIVRRYGG